MIEWRDTGILLSSRRHGEASAIVEIFTAEHGRHAGVVRGGGGRKMTPILQPGSQLDVTWKARLEEHLGAYIVEPVKARVAQVLADRLALAGMASACALLGFALPERESHPGFYRRTVGLFDMIGDNPVWPLAYLRWELALLDEMGFGLDLSRCAATGATEGLVYVSPKTGRAVSEAGAGAWKDRLLPLSPALLGEGDGDTNEVATGLLVTGHFLETQLAPSLGDRPVPEGRQRFVDLVGRG